jgi:predicted CXXCH cytochrome family protein
MRTFALAAGLVVCCVFAARSAEQPEQKNVYVGSDLCLRCHIDFARRWAALDHSKALLADTQPPEQRGCEACHGPGGDHVAGRRKNIVRWDDLDQEARSKVCLQCHQGKVEAEPWAATTHSELMSCDVCHEVHYQVDRDHLLRAKAEGAECSECHDIAAAVEAETHHTLVDGGLTCEQCHNPHGAPNAHLLTAPQAELCADCHGDEVPKPDSHAQEDWRHKHKNEAQGHEDQCYMCHDQESFCNQCHVVKVPHVDGYALEHTKDAREHLDACLRCHEKDFCLQCHDEVPPKPAEG